MTRREKRRRRRDRRRRRIRTHPVRCNSTGIGAAIGMAPDAGRPLFVLAIRRAVDGWNRVHGAEPKPEAPSDAEFDRMIEASAEAEARHGA